MTEPTLPELPHLQVAALKHLAGPFNEAFTREECESYARAYGLQCVLAERERQQAKIDALMMEYCPDEMTPEQVTEWGRHQVPAIRKG